MRTLSALLTFMTVMSSFSAFSQIVDSINSRFHQYLEQDLQEKIFVHTDKEAYLAGEIIWFKIYNVEAYSNRPMDISKVAYVEILTAENIPVIQIKVELKSGRGAGSIYLPVALGSGTYLFRTYTNLMKNFDPDFFYSKQIQVYNTVKDEDPVSKPISQHVNVQFFPEGGNLVSGFSSRVAFKGVNNLGEYVDFNGFVINSRQDTVLRFKPLRFGTGSFMFKPEKGLTYKALIKPVQSREFHQTLPPIYEAGVVMNLQRKDSILTLKLQNSLNDPHLKVFVHSGHKVVFEKSVSTSSAVNEIQIPIGILGGGISHFTVFNSRNEPLCERLFFKAPSSHLKLDLLSNKQTYMPREKVSLSLTQKNNTNPVSGDFSIAVYHTDRFSLEEDITSSLWLSAELKGKLKNASWYLANAEDEATDILMLTQGWRRFNWGNILNRRQTAYEFLPEVQGHIISGQLVNSSNAPVSGKIAYLSIPGGRVQFYTSQSDEAGNLKFYTRDFYGSSEIISQPADLLSDSLLKVEIFDPFSKRYSNFPRPGLAIDADKKELLKKSVSVQANNIFHSQQLTREKAEILDTLSFYRKPDRVYKFDDYVRFTTMEEVLREYVADLSVTQKRKSYQLRVFDVSNNIYHESDPLTLIDGVPVLEGNSIIKFDPLKVQRLELVRDQYAFGPAIFSGIASFHTYKKDLGGFNLPAQATVLDYSGLQREREFYSPMYPDDQNRNMRVPDLRNTLFWSPSNRTDVNGNAKLEFFTSDFSGNFLVVVQSLTDEGETGSQIMNFKVEDISTTHLNK